MLLDHFTSHFLQESRALFFSFHVFTGIKSSLLLSFEEQTEKKHSLVLNTFPLSLNCFLTE